MNAYFLAPAVFLPFAAGLLLYAARLKSWSAIRGFTLAVTAATSCLVWACLLYTSPSPRD